MPQLHLDEHVQSDHIDTRELVKRIMCESGLGFEPGWYDGSSCMVTRRRAVKKLHHSIKKYHDRGILIAQPLEPLFRQLVAVIKREETDTPYRLQRTWQATRLVILKHIELASVQRNTDHAIAVDEAKGQIAESFDTPQTDEEREYARRNASLMDPDGKEALRNRNKR